MDPLTMAVIAGGATSFLNSGAGLFSSAIQHKYNEELQQNAFNHQIRMYKNQNQWRVEDLRKAGLNPILSTHAGTAMPSASASSVSAPNLSTFDNPINSLAKMQGFSSSRDMQKFNRENHEVELAQKEADLAIRELQAESMRADIQLKGVNSALTQLDVDRRSRDWYKNFEDIRDLRNTFHKTSLFGRFFDDVFTNPWLETLHSADKLLTSPSSAIQIRKRPSKSTFTKYRYKTR